MDARVTDKLSHYVGGRRVEGQSGRYGDVYNPAIGEVTRQVPLASTEEVQLSLRMLPAHFLIGHKRRLPGGRRCCIGFGNC